MKTFTRDVSHDDSMMRELKHSPMLATEVFKSSITALAQEDELVGGLIALRRLQEIFGDLHSLAVAGECEANPLYQAIAGLVIPAFTTNTEYLNWFAKQRVTV